MTQHILFLTLNRFIKGHQIIPRPDELDAQKYNV